ncbi:MAG TPA: hypothetical protein VE973_02955 [Candidatus Limnocylindria bacterium]|nr:hypothetical protein [Candidatus Limnocylindria bacterium]
MTLSKQQLLQKTRLEQIKLLKDTEIQLTLNSRELESLDRESVGGTIPLRGKTKRHIANLLTSQADMTHRAKILREILQIPEPAVMPPVLRTQSASAGA